MTKNTKPPTPPTPPVRRGLKLVPSTNCVSMFSFPGIGIEDALRVHRWVSGVDNDLRSVHLAAAADRDAIDHGGIFALQEGSEAYKAWFKKLLPRLPSMALTRASGSDAWWWEGLDRSTGLVLLSLGALRESSTVAGVPVPAPLGLDYGDLMQGVLRAAGAGVDLKRRSEERASGGRRAQ